jgi:hypothetical protein
MLAIDITLLGAVLFTIPDYPSVMTGTFGFLTLIVVLFTRGRWMVGLLAYLTGWYVGAYLQGAGLSSASIGSLTGSMLTVAAIVAVTLRVRGWLGRLDANRSQMLGTVSHELRNNLTGMMGLTDVVVSTPDLEPAEALELIVLAHQQAVDATEIVEDLLTASRLEGSALQLNPEWVDINSEVADTARRFQGTGTEIGLTLGGDLSLAWADSLRCRQVMRNLLSNAIRYGGPVVTVVTSRSADAVRITVKDNGEGVPPEDEATIFMPYRRSTRGRRDASSVGLGLWISRQLAQRMDGALEYRRQDGLTEFIFSVPNRRPHQDGKTLPAQSLGGRRAAPESSGAASLMKGGAFAG